jgi:hypothetical protein
MNRTPAALLAVSTALIASSSPVFAIGAGSVGPGAATTVSTSTGPGAGTTVTTSNTSFGSPSNFNPNGFNANGFNGNNGTNANGLQANIGPTSTGIPITPNGTPYFGPNGTIFNNGNAFSGVSGVFLPPGSVNSLTPTSVVTNGGLNGTLYPGGGSMDGGGTTGQAFMPMLGGANPTSVTGPMQLVNNNPNARVSVLASRKIVTNGVASTVTSPVVTDYSWPSARTALVSHKSFARVYKRTACETKTVKHKKTIRRHRACS